MDDETFRTMMDTTAVVLESVDLDQYYGGHGPVDDAIGSLGRAWLDATAEQRASFAASLSRHARWVLGRYCLRAPMLALRARAGSTLHNGLDVYALLEQGTTDWRDDMIAFAPYYHAARQLGFDPAELFDEAATRAAPNLADVMRTFGRRSDVTLETFGWRQIETPEGPTLEMLGWKEGPTGAVVGDPSWEAVNGAMVRKLLQWVESQSERTRPN